jgi:hypothetical protein
MKFQSRILIPVIVILMVSLACTITIGTPSGSSQDDLLKKAVAQTLTAEAQKFPTQTQPTPVPPSAVPPQFTQLPTITPLPCNKGFPVSETIQDNTALNPNQNFIKMWRLKNIGSCTWNTNYKIVFSSGYLLGAAASNNFTMNTTPGETRDISVNMKAPAAAGTYKGIWKLVGDDGQIFGTVWVQIKVQPGVPVAHTVTLTAIQTEGGSVRSDGSVLAALPNVGDTAANVSSQAFVSFDMTVIPVGAIIQQVNMYFSGYDTLGDPFTTLGCLRLYQQNYGVLGAASYFGGAPLGAIARWCSGGELVSVYSDNSSFGSAVQTRVGSNRFQARFQFNEHATDSNGMDDLVRFGLIKMDVTYYVP